MSDHHFFKKGVLIASILLVLTTACGDPYDGDGKFVDAGFTAASKRYALDLGKIDLSQPKAYAYKLSGLPVEEFTIGLKVISPFQVEKHIMETKPINPLIKLILFDLRGEIVIYKEKYLSQWVWSGTAGDKRQSFVYLRGEYVKNSDPILRDGVLSDGGWGTYFTPQMNSSYRLMMEVVECDASSKPYAVSLIATGGGWK